MRRNVRIVAAAALAACALATAGARAAVMINEVDYDQPSFDTTEFVELAGTAGTNLSGWTLTFINGADGTSYLTVPLPSFTFADETGTGWGFFVLGRPTVANNDMDLGADGSVQNGAPDGIQLFDPGATLVQYVSYEGTMAGANDVIGVADDGVSVGSSVYKTGTGAAYGDFTWAFGENVITPGGPNPGQVLVPEPSGVGWVAIAGAAVVRRGRRRGPG
jgi:hypothetical protein